MSLYNYQDLVKSHLLNGCSVILQAPTGSGKTRAALAPFIEAFFDQPDDAFPKQCLYSVPMRVLASQFYREYRELAERYERVHRRKVDVRIQTGERPEDPDLVGDLVFATLDQTLSSALGVPYSLSAGRANLNVGAVLGSYLVFDEFHLFPLEATQATLQLLRLVGRLAPFLLMTATFSQTMLEAIGGLLKARVVVVPPDEVASIETQQGQRPRKQRRFEVTDQELAAKAVLEAHDRRSLAVCNTVDRAIALYEQLRQAGCQPVPVDDPPLAPIYQALAQARGEGWDRAAAQGVQMLRERLADGREGQPWVMLLHSRFERPHRQLKEALLQALWNPQGLEAGGSPSLIVVATQVVEVGLDISAQTLHTEIAPAASVLQRAGRCARYPGEQGRVIVYPVPVKENGEPNYAPYGGSKAEVAVCDRSWQALRERQGAILDFAAEQEVINQAHSEADAAMLQAMREGQGEIWQRITDALVRGDASARPQLIRKVDSRTVIVYEPPFDLSEESPYRFEGISLWHGTLRGRLKELNRLRDELGLDWALRYPAAQGDEAKDEEVAYRWLDAETPDDIGLSLIFAVHPRLAAYDAEHGLRLGLVSDGSYASPTATVRRQRPDYAGYQLESYPAHIAAMRRIFEGDPASRLPVADGRLRRRLAWAARRFADQDGDWRVPKGLLERAVRLSLALHDVGKLSEEWQRFAAKYQEAIGEGAPTFLVAHTHYERGNPVHEEAQKKVRRYKPSTHAGEGASASVKVLFKALEGQTCSGLYRAAFAAIARHHSPGLEDAKPYRLHAQAGEAVADALAAGGGGGGVGDASWRGWAQGLRSGEEAPNVGRHLPEAPPDGDWAWWFQYFIIVRILRLCDGLSQEEGWMYQDIYYVPKRTGTYSDVLVAYGLATLLDHIFRQVKDQSERWRITLEDGGGHYLVRLSEPVREEWVRGLPPLRNPAPRITRGENEPDDGSARGENEPDDGSARNVDATWSQVKLWGEQRKGLAEQGVRGTDLEQQLRELEPPQDWATVVFLGDSRMQADGIYNRIVSQWAEARKRVAEHISALLSLFARPDFDDDTALEAWNRLAKRDGIKPKETASQLLNPHQGKGLNETKANALRMDNIKDRPWPEEFLKAIGLWHCLAPRQTMDTNDWKAYVLAPLRLSWQAHREAFDRFNRYLWRERGNQTALKTDITSVLLFARAWLNYVEAAWRDEDDFDLPTAPEKVVAGFHVAQFKLLSRNAYTMVNLSFLSLPAWSGDLRTRDDVVALQEIIDEHLDVVRGIDEGHSDGFDLLRRYRDFLSTGDWDAFFDFAAGYSHEILRRLNDGARFVPTFTTSRLRRLMMTNRKDLTLIVENSGFQNVAYAIRHATIVPQTRKANNQDNLYEVRYGLGAELKRKGTVRDEFVAALTDFIQSYNQENVQKLESKGQQMRRDVRTDDIAQVVHLIDEYGSEVVANLLIAYGYAREPREEQPNA